MVLGGLSKRLRQCLYSLFLRELRPTEADRILDIGLTNEVEMVESNLFEQLYPVQERLVELSIDSISGVKKTFPKVGLVQVDGLTLPFSDGTFDIVVSHATLEHVGTRSAQEKFVREMLRVGRQCFLTTPNRWFPLELHTFLPLLHYLPARKHRRVLETLKMTLYAQEENLNLLTRRQLHALFPTGKNVQIITTLLRTNLVAIA